MYASGGTGQVTVNADGQAQAATAAHRRHQRPTRNRGVIGEPTPGTPVAVVGEPTEQLLAIIGELS